MKSKPLRFVDLFCGLGGFRLGLEPTARDLGYVPECVLSSDIDPDCQVAYAANFGERPLGDIRMIDAEDVPDHDLLLAGFPCQPFSIIGHKRGFEDTRGTLFFEIARILAAKRPRAFILENVKMLVGHQKGATIKRIETALRDLGYHVDIRVLNALDFGLPQKRERVIIVGSIEPIPFLWPEPAKRRKTLSKILEKTVPERYYASSQIQESRSKWHSKDKEPTIWHENKAGHVSKYPFSCALRAGASYNYLLVNGERRLTEREMLRLQGFPDSYKIVCGYSATRRQAGNAIPVPMVAAVCRSLIESPSFANYPTGRGQYSMIMEKLHSAPAAG